MFKNFSGKILKFANGLAADYYSKDHKNSDKNTDKKKTQIRSRTKT